MMLANLSSFNTKFIKFLIFRFFKYSYISFEILKFFKPFKKSPLVILYYFFQIKNTAFHFK